MEKITSKKLWKAGFILVPRLEFTWSHVCLLLKDPAEIVRVCIAALYAGFFDADFRLFQEFFRFFYSDPGEIFNEVLARFLLEDLAEIIRADIYLTGNLIQ